MFFFSGVQKKRGGEIQKKSLTKGGASKGSAAEHKKKWYEVKFGFFFATNTQKLEPSVPFHLDGKRKEPQKRTVVEGDRVWRGGGNGGKTNQTVGGRERKNGTVEHHLQMERYGGKKRPD